MKDPFLLLEARALVREGVEFMTVWTPQGWRAPRGFPRKELLCVPSMGGKTWRVNAARLVKFLESQA
jgi:hypothetical protein